MKKNKLLILIIGILLLISGLSVLLISKNKPSTEKEEIIQKKIEPINQIPVSERPYTQIFPRKDGREVSIIVNKLKDYQEVEYELEYEAGSLLQGAFGKIDFSQENPPVIRNLLLGSCSAGGKCSYHEEVNGGTLVLRYKNGDITKLKGEWNYQTIGKNGGSVSSRDAKYFLEIPSKVFSQNTFLITYQTFGLPATLEGNILAGPYSTSFAESSKPLISKESFQLTLQLSEFKNQPVLYAWNGNDWTEQESKVTDRTLKAQLNSLSTIVVVEKPLY